jgi:uncharacterized protein YbjT (DUF2867 family)
MKVVLFGATGMIGQGVLRECLLAPAVTDVLTVGRTPTGRTHAKLRELTHPDLGDLTPIGTELAGYDACLFCLGVSSAGMSEAAYRRVTYDYAMAAARVFATGRPEATFIYVSGVGTDRTEKGRSMWARVKGKTENDLLALLSNAYMFRPGYIHPMHGITSRTRLYRAGYVVMKPLYPLLRRLFPTRVTTTELIGKAMVNVAANGAPTRVLAPSDINAAAG